MAQHILHYKASKVAWHRFGQGPEAVVCFHGYGESADSFEFMGRHAGPAFTFYCIDLPFHGYTEWKEGMRFTHTDLLAVIEEILGDKERMFSVMGFSLGGRIALSLYQAIPQKIKKLLLFAPDGLKVNFWYRVATETKGGNRFFHFTMKHPGWFFGILKFFYKLGLLNKSIFKFVNYYIGDEKVREDLYTRWTSFRKLKPNLVKIKEAIRLNKTPVKLVYGKHDRIILPVVGEKFRKGMEEYCDLRIIEAGHQVMHENYAGVIIEALKS